MKQRKPFRIAFPAFCDRAAAWIAGVFFACLTVVSLVMTCRIDIGYSAENSEHVSFLLDNVPVNLLVLAAAAALVCLLFSRRLTEGHALTAMLIVSVLSAVLGVVWVTASKSLPSADSASILAGAEAVLSGNGDALVNGGYFRKYPFQLGYLLWTELIYRVFGIGNTTALGILNVVCVLATDWAVFCISKKLFDEPGVHFLTAVFLGLCLQPVFLCTFLYGFVPGLAFASWSLYFVIVTVRSDRPLLLIPAGVLIALAIAVKTNFQLFFIAECIVLALYIVLSRRLVALVLTALSVLLCIFAPKLVQGHYEKRLDTSFGSGTPLTAWLVTGMRESSFCSGWWNGYTWTVYADNGYDLEKTKAQIRTDALEQLDLFLHRPRYLASFLFHKVTSQWNEPMYQSIWASASGKRTAPAADWVTSLGTGRAAHTVEAVFNQIMQIVYVGLTVGLFALTRREHSRPERTLIPVVLIGGVLYHAMFEAKAMYSIIYVPLMLPFAAFGYQVLSGGITRKKGASRADL